MRDPTLKRQNFKQAILAVFFPVAIALPCLGTFLQFDLVGKDSTEARENRTLAAFPKFEWNLSSLKKFPAQFEAYYNDHFGFRNTLILGHNFLKVKALNESPSENVILGKDGWLFYTEADLIEEAWNQPFTLAELEKWRRVLEARRDWLAAQGIHYLFAIAPDKQTIYPEYLPDSLQKIQPRSRLDQLVDYLDTHSDLVIVDLRDTLKKAKQSYRVYHRTDSHWNKPGVFSAYQTILGYLNNWFPKMQPLTLADFEIEKRDRIGGDLANMLGLKDILREEGIKFSPRVPPQWKEADPGIYRPDLPKTKQPFATEIFPSNLPRAVVFHDSFGLNLAPLIAEHFQRILFVQQYEFDPTIIQREQPDVVIQEIVERALKVPPPENPPEIEPGESSSSD